IGEALDTSAWKRPFNFQPVEFVALAQPKNDAWIMRGEIAAAANFHAAALQIACLISDARAHRVRIRLLANQLYSQPMILVAIIVIVKKLQTPSAHEFGGFADARGKRQVVKCFVMIVFIYGEHFAVEVSHEQAHPSVITEISRVHAHAGSRPAAITVSNAGG